MTFLITFLAGFWFWSPVQAAPCLSPIELERLRVPLQSTAEAQAFVRDMAIRFWQCEDLHGLFAEVYRVTLSSIEARIEGQAFHDPDRVRHLLVAHTNLYREALLLEFGPTSRGMPKAWETAFSALRSGQYKPGTVLVLSMNAHIAYDLPKALLIAGVPFESETAKSDFDEVTSILKESMDVLWDAFRKYDHQSLVLPKFAELRIMVNWAAWMRQKAWREAKACSLDKNGIPACVEAIDKEAGQLASNYRKLDWFLHEE